MDSFCGGTPFWNVSLTWGDSSTYPEFSECFQYTVLVWVASGWLWITAPIYLTYLARCGPATIPSSWRNTSKLFLAVLQVIICVVELAYTASELNRKDETYWQAYFVAPVIVILTLLLVILYIELERRRGFITSGVLFIYWVVAILTKIIPFYSIIIKKQYESELLKSVLFYIYVAISLAQLVLSSFPEKSPPYTGKSPCPETSASFLSRITFSWITKMVVLGYKRPLTEQDMFYLNPREQSSTVVPRFQTRWENAERKLSRGKHRYSTRHQSARSQQLDECELSESTPLLGASSHADRAGHQAARKRVSLLKVLAKTFGWQFLLSNIWKLFYDILVFVNPLLLRAMIDFVEDPTTATWKGYVMASGFFVATVVGCACYEMCALLCNAMGLKLRAATISAIYRKSKYGLSLLWNFHPVHVKRVLIDFVEDSSQPSWKGYVLCTGFLCVIVLQALTFHQLFYQTTTLGLRLRTAVISAVFEKSMTMNNQARTESTVGEIVNLMSVDAEHIRDICGYIWGVWSSPLQIIVALVFLYYTVGMAMFAGLGVMVVLVPVNGFVVKKIQGYQVEQMTQKDRRIKLMTEILNGIKILKLYAWELAFGDKVLDVRAKELKVLRKAAIINAFMTFSWTVAPFTVGLATFATYIFIQDDHRLDAQTAFVAISLFNILRFALMLAPIIIMEFVKAIVSVRRMNRFLNHDDLDFTNVSHNTSVDAVTVKDGTFVWDPELGPCLKDINLSIPKGSLVAVVGTVGSGKSSLISAFLGEMERVRGHVNVDGRTAYVPQQAWIQNATLRDNVLFGNAMNATTYENIIDACALRPDLEILQAKDMTEIGEKGINLSGGQRQRVSLARSVYFDAEVYLLDDPLSAVDSHVGKHIFERVVGREGLLKHKTRVLVTHGVQWLPAVDNIIVMDHGVISEVGSYEELMEHDGAFAQFLRTYLTEMAESEDEDDDEAKALKAVILERLVSIASDSPTSEPETLHFLRQRSHKQSESEHSHLAVSSQHLGRTISRSRSRDEKGALTQSMEDKQMKAVSPELKGGDTAKLIEEEALETGRVRWEVVVSYARAVGIPFSILIFILYGSYQACAVGASIWLTGWTANTDLQNLTSWPPDSQDRRDQNDYYLGIYGAFGIAQGIFVLSYSTIAVICMVTAAAVLHENMLRNVLRGPLSFFDTTPVGRIVNRFSQDVSSIDQEIPQTMEMFLDCLFVVISTLVVISYSTPIFLSIIVPVAVLYFFIQRFYIPTSRQLKRLESKTRSPIYNNFSESLTGASVIRAFKVQDRFIAESERRVDHNQEYAFANYTVNRWLGFRLEVLGAFIVLAAAIFAVLERENINGSLVGLSISYALQITDNMNWLVRMTSELETNIVSVERVGQYTVVPTEAPLKTVREPQPDWPDRGIVEFRSFSVRYREGLDLVLRSIDIAVRSGEKVGIVGRTGAGKSSLTLSLFRLIEPAGGKIVIDGEDVSSLGLHDLRSRLTILPQEPVLFSGSLRMNLDPLDEHSDSRLWVALEHAHLKSFVESLPQCLEYEVGEGGQNLSVGQRQLMCLARSLLRKSKILVLDEATAAVDMETDDLIQNTIAVEFKDCTVLTIAHRLNTVMDYDRILVLDAGQVREFDTPQNLLQNTDSMFYSMARDAGLV